MENMHSNQTHQCWAQRPDSELSLEKAARIHQDKKVPKPRMRLTEVEHALGQGPCTDSNMLLEKGGPTRTKSSGPQSYSPQENKKEKKAYIWFLHTI